ncbi:MAG TPA: hypothetical protein VFT49_00485 [Candidatus Saccharimonadales bacterium]|nr:hypothetical protein [Candidatus Saccharimonadales bacterium]
MRAFWVFIIMVAAIVGWFGGTNNSTQIVQVNDVSWPNCGVALQRTQAGIVGITGGLALRPNPCLNQEASKYKNLSVYINTGYPGPHVAHQFQLTPKDCSPGDKQCLAYNYGYNSAVYAIKYSLMNGVVAKNWWLDVETENSWDGDAKVNRAALSGSLDALAGFVGRQNLGFYSYPGQWDLLTGKWRNQYPAWVATGSTERRDAQLACDQSSFTGGPVVLAQYTKTLDEDLAC